MIWQVVLIFLLAWLAVLRWKSRKLRWAEKQMKTNLSRYPLIGDAHHFIGDGQVRISVLHKIGRHAINNNGWSSMKLGNSLFGFVADAEDADYILKRHLEKSDIVKFSQILIGNGSLFAPVSIWRPRRKVLAPTFSQHNLNHFVDIFSHQSKIMADNLAKKADSDKFSIWKYLTSYTMDSVCHTTLGVNLSIQKNPDHYFLKNLQKFTDLSAYRLFRPWLLNDTFFKVLGSFGTYDMFMKSVSYLRNFVIEIVKMKREELKNKAVNKKGEDKPRFRPILELLIEATGGDKGYTDEELQEETQVVLSAGTDTSAVGTGFVTLMLAQHPDVQEKVYKEIHDLYGDSERPITAEDLSRLPYLEVVIKESLRLYPPAPLVVRKIEKADVTPSGVTLVPGMQILVCLWALQRNPKYWGSDAEEFRPERFFDSPPTHPAAFSPFSTGPRNCLGYKYAMLSMMTATATLLRRYRVLPPDDDILNKPLRLTYEIMMKHADNYQVKLARR